VKLAIIKYNAGNTVSVANALRRLGVEATVTDDPDTIRRADKVIFPGVGEASSAMAYLQGRGLDKVIPTLTQPVLGICLGMQLMCGFSEENDTKCLGIFPYLTQRFSPGSVKVPHTGWNQILGLKSPLFDGVPEHSYFYFVHGYYVGVCNETTAVAEHGMKFSAGINRDNFYAVQFHPEKSGEAGEKILANFLNL
jgi:glutamine amidotransferase